MASLSKVTKTKRRNRERKVGLKRKRRLSKKSTLSQEELFSHYNRSTE